MSKTLKVFITYSHENQDAKDELIKHLAVMKQQDMITIWHDNEILPGDRWYEDISKNLADSDILLYLVSASSLASKNCNKELAEALSGKIRIIPIILGNCDWQNHQLSGIQALPDQGKPINEWQPENKGWQNVVAGLRRVVGEMRTQASDSVQEETLPEWMFQQGNFLMMLREIDKAIEAYSYVIELKPNNATTYINRGIAYHIKGELDRALEDLNKAIELNPKFALAYNNRGTAYSDKGAYNLAIADYSKAIELKPDYATAYYGRGAAYHGKDEIDPAIADYSKAIELNPELALAYCNRGYGSKGAYNLAIADYSKAIELNPELDLAFSNRGTIYISKGAYDRAISDYNNAIRLNPNDADVYNNRGTIYSINGDLNHAIADYSKAIELNPELALTYCNRGMCWLRLRSWQEARLDLTIAKYMGIDIIAAYHKNYNNVATFEQSNQVNLPEDIAAMLTPD